MTRQHDDHAPDADLRALLGDAVDDIEPGERLAAIRAAAAAPQRADDPDSPDPSGSTPLGTKVTPMRNRRPWLYAVTGAAVATAAVLTVITLAGGSVLGGDDPDPAASSESTDPSEGPSESPSESPDPSEGASEPAGDESPGEQQRDADPAPPVTGEMTVPVYYTGAGPGGPVLFREFHRASVSDESDARLTAAAREAVSGTPLDPDYRSDWPAVTVQQVDLGDGEIAVDLDGAPGRGELSQREAMLALQQVVYTVQGAAQDRAPVRFTVDGEDVAEVLGVDTSEPVGNAPMLSTLSLMSITAPYEGEEVSGTLEASGVNNSFEATVVWQVRDAEDLVVAEGAGIAEGYMEPRLFAWSVEIDVSDLDAGRYTLVTRNDDPTGATPASDSRSFVIR